VVYLIAQLSDVHVGGPHAGSGERFSEAIAELNAMHRRPDLVLLTGDNTHNGTEEEWEEFTRRLSALDAPWEAINGEPRPGDRGRHRTPCRGGRAAAIGARRLCR
jgi:3',5'-cyclic AMP phosphodiesterase CpdA